MIYDSWNIRCDRHKFLSFWVIFCPFSPMTTQNFKIEKSTGDIIILNICTINNNHMMHGSWDMECNRQNFLSFWTIFFPFTTPLWAQKIKIFKKMEKTPEDFTNINESYVWFFRHGVQRTGLFVIFNCFLPFYCPNNPKNQNFAKMKKLSGDIIILHRCNINDNNMMYGSWDTNHDRQNFLSFWTILCPFTTLTTQKIKIWKNETKPS